MYVISSFDPQYNLMKQDDYCPHLKDKETEAERSNLPKVTQVKPAFELRLPSYIIFH